MSGYMQRMKQALYCAVPAVVLGVAASAQALTYADQVNLDGAIRYYRLGEAGGPTAIDAKGNGNGTYNNFLPLEFNQPGALNGDANTAVLFDGIDNTVSVASAPSLNITGDLTIEFWMNKNAEAGDWQRLVGKGDTNTRTFGVWEEAGAAKHILFQQYNGAGAASVNFLSGSTVEIGQWHHVVATVSGTTASIYIDGILDATATRTLPIGTDGNPLTIGAAPSLHTFFPGRLDEVAIYDKALTASQVKSHFLAGANLANLHTQIIGDAPQAYYRYNDGGFHSQPPAAIDSIVLPENAPYFGGVTIAQGLDYYNSDGHAAKFDGVDDYARIPASLFSNVPSGGPMTFETWFNSTSSGVILGQTNAGTTPSVVNPTGWVPAIHLGTDGVVRSEMFWHNGVSPIASPGTYNDGQWHHIVNTFEDGVEKLYIDGVLVGQAGVTQFAYAGSYDYYLGTGYTASWTGGNGGWHYFNGRLDETAIYNRALNVSEIRSHFFAGLNAMPEPGTLSLLALSGLALIGRRTRKA